MKRKTKRNKVEKKKSGSETSRSEVGVDIVLRIRPLIKWEIDRKGTMKDIELISDSSEITVKTKIKSFVSFKFRRIFDCSSTQEEVYDDVVTPLFDRFFEGFNSTIIAYGQTTSGKSFTLNNCGQDESQHGVAPRLINNLWERLKNLDPENKNFSVKLCFFEIYLGKFIDLLKKPTKRFGVKKMTPRIKVVTVNNHNSSNNSTNSSVKSSAENESTIRSKVIGLRQPRVRNRREMQKLLEFGERNRKISLNGLGTKSSRSHSVFQIIMANREVGIESRFNIIDLAGSERILKSGAYGVQRQEAISINRSLSTLGKVIYSLNVKTNRHTPYRESKLTMFLRNSFGKSGYASMILTCSPCHLNTPETLSTLRFGQICQKVKSRPVRHSLVPSNWNEKSRIVKKMESKLKDLEFQVSKRNKEVEELRRILLLKERNEKFLEDEIIKKEHVLKEREKEREKKMKKLESEVDERDKKIIHLESKLESEKKKYEEEKQTLAAQLERIEEFMEKEYFSPSCDSTFQSLRSNSGISQKVEEEPTKEEEEEQKQMQAEKEESSNQEINHEEEEIVITEEEEGEDLEIPHREISIDEEESQLPTENSRAIPTPERRRKTEINEGRRRMEVGREGSGTASPFIMGFDFKSRNSYDHLINKINKKDETILELEDEIYTLKRELCYIKISEMENFKCFSDRVITKMNRLTWNEEQHHRRRKKQKKKNKSRTKKKKKKEPNLLFKKKKHQENNMNKSFPSSVVPMQKILGVVKMRLSKLLSERFDLSKNDVLLRVRKLYRTVIKNTSEKKIAKSKKRYTFNCHRNRRKFKRLDDEETDETEEEDIHFESPNFHEKRFMEVSCGGTSESNSMNRNHWMSRRRKKKKKDENENVKLDEKIQYVRQASICGFAKLLDLDGIWKLRWIQLLESQEDGVLRIYRGINSLNFFDIQLRRKNRIVHSEECFSDECECNSEEDDGGFRVTSRVREVNRILHSDISTSLMVHKKLNNKKKVLGEEEEAINFKDFFGIEIKILKRTWKTYLLKFENQKERKKWLNAIISLVYFTIKSEDNTSHQEKGIFESIKEEVCVY